MLIPKTLKKIPMNQKLMNQKLMNQKPMNQKLMNQKLMNQKLMNQKLMNQKLMNLLLKMLKMKKLIKLKQKRKQLLEQKKNGNYVMFKNLYGLEINLILLMKNIVHFIKVFQMIGKMNLR